MKKKGEERDEEEKEKDLEKDEDDEDDDDDDDDIESIKDATAVILHIFLDASSHLCMRVCPSARRSVRPLLFK